MTERIWDQYLSEQDRAHVQQLPNKPFGYGTAPALVLIDIYRKVFGDRPEPLLSAIRTSPHARSVCGMAAWDALPHIQSLLAVARESAIPVIHVAGLTDVPLPTDTNETRDDIGSNKRTTAYEIMSEIAPIKGEVVLRKAAPSGYFGTPLAGILNQLHVDTVVVIGESTSGCVRATVVDAHSYRYRVVVVEECVFDRTESAHALSLFDMDRKYADVISLPVASDYFRAAARTTADSPA